LTIGNKVIIKYLTAQSSVATQLSCGEIFNNYFIAHCPQSVLVKKF